MAELVYLDATGSVGRGARNQPELTLVAVVVDEMAVQPLADRLWTLTFERLGRVSAGFELHAQEMWNAKGHWATKQPSELLAAFEAAVEVLSELDISVVHATIDKGRLSAWHGGTYHHNAYLLALQFLLEKLDGWRTR